MAAGYTGDYIEVRMQLIGSQTVVSQNTRVAESYQEVGAAAKEAGVAAGQGAAASSAAAVKQTTMISSMQSAGKTMKSTGSQMTQAFTIPLALLGGASIDFSMKFSDAMEQLHTQAGVAQKDIGTFKKHVLDYMGTGTTPFPGIEQAQALYRIASHGYTQVGEAMTLLKKSNELAMVGHTDLESAARTIGAVLNSHIKGVHNLNDALGTMNATVGQGSLRMGDLIAAMGTGVLPRAQQAGISLRDVGAALAEMTRQNVLASSAATRFQQALVHVMAPTDKGIKTLKELGLSHFELANIMRNQGLFPMLDQLHKSLAQFPIDVQKADISDIFGGGKMSGAMFQLQANLQDAHKVFDKIGSQAGEFGGDVAQQQRQPITKLHESLVILDKTLIELGNTLMPLVIPAIRHFADAIGFLGNTFQHLPQGIQRGILYLGLFLMVVGPLLSMIGMMTLGISGLARMFRFFIPAVAEGSTAAEGGTVAFASLDAAVLLIPGAILLAAAGFIILYEKVKWFRDGVNATWSWIKQHWPLLAGILLAPMTGGFSLIIAGAYTFRGTLRSWGESIIHWFATAWKNVSHWISHPFVVAFHWVTNAFNNMLHFITSLPGRILHAITGLASTLYHAGINLAKELMKGVWHSIPGPIRDALGWGAHAAGNVAGTVAGAGKSAIDFVGGFATGGTLYQTGMAVVGESGPELMRLPKGTRIEPLIQQRVGVPAASMLAGQTGGGGPKTIVVPVNLDGKTIARVVAKVAADDAARR